MVNSEWDKSPIHYSPFTKLCSNFSINLNLFRHTNAC